EMPEGMDVIYPAPLAERESESREVVLHLEPDVYLVMVSAEENIHARPLAQVPEQLAGAGDVAVARTLYAEQYFHVMPLCRSGEKSDPGKQAPGGLIPPPPVTGPANRFLNERALPAREIKLYSIVKFIPISRRPRGLGTES